MLLGLPDDVALKIGEQYRAAVESARVAYPDVREDEDSVTGALSFSMHEKVRGVHGDWIWQTHAKKLRGRGKGAAEKRIGADLAIEIEVTGANLERRKKTVFAQAKKEWIGKDNLLGGQARKLAELPGGALVIDYRANGFRSVTARQAADADGNARDISADAFRSLADVLADDFLACRVGSTAVHYDASHQALVSLEHGEVRLVRFALAERIRTEVWRPASPSDDEERGE